MFKLPGLTVVSLLLAVTMAAAQPACLPSSVFAKAADEESATLDLGYIDNVLTLCAYKKESGPNMDKRLGCWTVNPNTAALGASAATAIPGRGRRAELDAQGCVNGYCIAPMAPDDNRPFFATSTDGVHAAVMTDHLLTIFATNTKAKTTEIELVKADAPEATNISNQPWGLLYNGDTLFVIGSDAGPFIGVWVFKEDGSRAGRVGSEEYPLNIFNGGYGILGRDKVAFADVGLHALTTVTGANVARQRTKRNASYAPCTSDRFEEWANGDSNQTRACRRVLDARFEPYVDISPVELPSGELITALRGPAQGYIAVLNPAGLTEKRRLKLARCL
jgi:hypothetical protein